MEDSIRKFYDSIMKCPLVNDKLSISQYKACKIRGMNHSEEDFCKEIESLSSRSACGPDGWSSDLIKRLKYPIARFLKSIYEKSMEEGRFPDNLKHAYVVGIFSTG